MNANWPLADYLQIKHLLGKVTDPPFFPRIENLPRGFGVGFGSDPNLLDERDYRTRLRWI